MSGPGSGRLDGRVAFITGTGGGQGRAAAELFAREGATVWGCDLRADGAQETVDRIVAAGGRAASLHPLDLTEEGGARRWIEEGVARFGRIDVLYNNASHAVMRRLGDADMWEAWQTTIRGELDLVFATIEAAWPHLVRQGRGSSIVNTSSTAALRGLPLPESGPGSSTGHSAAKAGLLGLTRQVAAEGASYGIRANAVLPGFIDAPVTSFILDQPGARERIGARLPLGRVGRPEDVAFAALYFACDESAWVTGETLTVDGGAVSVAMPR